MVVYIGDKDEVVEFEGEEVVDVEKDEVAVDDQLTALAQEPKH